MALPRGDLFLGHGFRFDLGRVLPRGILAGRGARVLIARFDFEERFTRSLREIARAVPG